MNSMKAFLLTIALVSTLVISAVYQTFSQQPTPNQTESNADHGGNQAFIEEVSASTGDWLASVSTPIFENQAVEPYTPPSASNTTNVLGSTVAADGSEKWIEVDISDQR